MPPRNANHGRGTTVFLCHASEDKPAVRDLYSRLRRDGIRPWLDEEELLPGQDWEPEIKKAVRSCRIVIVCLSNKSLTKEGFVNKEIKTALDVAEEKPEGTIYIVPARLQNCEVPSRLRKWQWVDLFDERGYEKLLHTLASPSSRMNPDPTLLRQYETEVKRIKNYALSKAQEARWMRPDMYFNEQEMIDHTGIDLKISYSLLSALREAGDLICVNWKGASVWSATPALAKR